MRRLTSLFPPQQFDPAPARSLRQLLVRWCFSLCWRQCPSVCVERDPAVGMTQRLLNDFQVFPICFQIRCIAILFRRGNAFSASSPQGVGSHRRNTYRGRPGLVRWLDLLGLERSRKLNKDQLPFHPSSPRVLIRASFTQTLNYEQIVRQ